MTSTELKRIFKKNNKSDWILDKSFKLPKEILNKHYISLQCKKCGHKKKHNLGNIKHTLFKDNRHCRCQNCYLKQKKIDTSMALLARVESRLRNFTNFSWILNKSKIKLNKLYTSKTPLPLVCRICKTTVYHSSSNIQTCTINHDHICCQVCKLRNIWKLKIEQRTKGKYTLDINRTELGYKLIHKKCGNYYYTNNPHIIRKGLCPFCYEDKYALNKMRDKQQLKLFVEKESGDKLSFHLFDFNTKMLHVSCNLHATNGKYTINWNAFLRSKNKRGIFSCRSCGNQRLRNTTFYEYNKRIEVFGLRIEENCRNTKIDTKEKILHYCINVGYHPPFYASPYEVESKNKKCPYCFNSIGYRKDYHFIKSYVEMDEDRCLTHSGRKFRLLSTKEEIERQIKVNKHIASIIIRINELTCPIHNEYKISWGSFCYRNTGCRKCSKESNVSYAHFYYQALLEYFGLDYIPEFPIKVNAQTTYRIDFKLSTKPNYLEIDSIIHVRGWVKSNQETYKERDRLKDLKLYGNLERIKLYDNNQQELAIREQLNVIESAFIERVFRNNLAITKQAIDKAKMDPAFFNNARIGLLIKKLAFFHSRHIEFKSNDHFTILQSREADECEFYCNIHQESFKRNLSTVLNMHFMCPVCMGYVYFGTQRDYYLCEEKINLINNHVEVRFGDRFTINFWIPKQPTFFFRTIVFPVIDNVQHLMLYMPLRDLLSLPIASVIKKLKKGEYDRYKTNRTTKYSPRIKHLHNHNPVKIEYISNDVRAKLNAKSESQFKEYQRKAKLINRLMKQRGNNSYIDKLILENEAGFNKFFHKTNLEATLTLGTYDRKIVPFFHNQDEFELHSPRAKYAYNKQLLLIKDRKCSHFFYCSWSYMTIKKKKGLPAIQCQRKECYEIFYRTRNLEPRKIPQESILQIFKELFHGQYYPTYPDRKILVREPISITHVPSRTILNASIDNFRRGKFRSEYKNLTLKQLKKNFPSWRTGQNGTPKCSFKDL